MLHNALVLKGLSKTTMRRIAEQIHDENASHGMFRINDKTIKPGEKRSRPMYE